jgi:peptidoglycan LD-endopeptidase LytH
MARIPTRLSARTSATRRSARVLALGGLLGGLLAACGGPPAAQPEPGVTPPAPPPTTQVTTGPGPTPTAPGPTAPPVTRRPPARPPAVTGAHRYVFPVRTGNVSYGRTHHDYPATDIFAACKSPVVAATDGVVLETTLVDRYDPAHPDGALKGGLSVSIRGDDGVRYYGSHLTRVLPGISAGVRVKAGQQIGTVGKTGNASNVCHLHFGISPLCAGTKDWWIRRGVIWPATYLDAWRAGSSRAPVSEVSTWRRKHRCPPNPGKTG